MQRVHWRLLLFAVCISALLLCAMATKRRADDDNNPRTKRHRALRDLDERLRAREIRWIDSRASAFGLCVERCLRP